MFKLILSFLLAYSPTFISVFFNMDSKIWYGQLVKPSFSPPSWVFGVVWSVLYFLIGVSLYLFWNSNVDFIQKKTGFTIFGMQLLLNASFTPIFFGLKSLLGGFIICLLMSIFVVLTIISFYKISPISSYLLVPYLFWGLFATFLSYKILVMNS